MLKLGVKICDQIVALNMFYGTKTCHPKVQNAVVQKRSIPGNYKVTAIE